MIKVIIAVTVKLSSTWEVVKMLNTINELYEKVPTPVNEIYEILNQILDECGLSPYCKGETKKITKLIKRTSLDVIKLEHRYDYEFGSAMMTYITFSSWDENGQWNPVVFEYCWG